MTNIVIFPGEENTLIIIGLMCTVMSTVILLTIFSKEIGCTWKSKWLLDTEMSNVLDLFTKSSLLDIRAQNKINCLLGPTKSPTNDGAEESLVQENNCKEIVQELLWTNHYGDKIWSTHWDWVWETQFLHGWRARLCGEPSGFEPWQCVLFLGRHSALTLLHPGF